MGPESRRTFTFLSRKLYSIDWRVGFSSMGGATGKLAPHCQWHSLGLTKNLLVVWHSV